MDDCGIEAIVNLDGMWGDELEANLDRYDRAHPGRFATFAQLDRDAGSRAETGPALGAQMADSARRGARGLKVWKDLGLHLRDGAGALVMPDDPRLDPVWDAVRRSRRSPSRSTSADPVGVLRAAGRAQRAASRSSWRTPTGGSAIATGSRRSTAIIDALEALIARRSDVTCIGAHVLCFAEDLAWVGRMLDTYPNVYADVAARIAELGRVPRATRELIVRHADRFVFGTDAFPPDGEATRSTAASSRPPTSTSRTTRTQRGAGQGRWTISGLDLPSDVLDACVPHERRRCPRQLISLSRNVVTVGLLWSLPWQRMCGAVDAPLGNQTYPRRIGSGIRSPCASISSSTILTICSVVSVAAVFGSSSAAW